MVWHSSLCRAVADTTLLRDLAWASSSCLLSWRTVGAWSQEQELTAACRSQAGGWVPRLSLYTLVPRLLAVGDDQGQVRLLSHPACQPSSLGHCHPGHSSSITRSPASTLSPPVLPRLTFLGDDSRLVTAGLDSALLQWAVQ